jgi:hypothetical protein
MTATLMRATTAEWAARPIRAGRVASARGGSSEAAAVRAPPLALYK